MVSLWFRWNLTSSPSRVSQAASEPRSRAGQAGQEGQAGEGQTVAMEVGVTQFVPSGKLT